MKRYIRAAVKDLSNTPDDEKLIIIQDPNTPSEIVDSLYADLSWLERLLSDGTQQDYVDADNFCVAVGSDPNTPPEVLYKLWEATETVAVLHNPSFPIDKLEQLTNLYKTNIDDYYQYNIACNPNATPKILDMLSTVRSDDVRKLVAEHPNTASDTLQELLIDEDAIADAAIANLKERGEIQ